MRQALKDYTPEPYGSDCGPSIAWTAGVTIGRICLDGCGLNRLGDMSFETLHYYMTRMCRVTILGISRS